MGMCGRILAAGIGVFLAAGAAARQAQQPPEQLFSKGVELHRSGQYEAAAKAYEAFLAVRPDAVEAISNLGAVYARLGNYGKAIDNYKRALAIDGSNAGVRFNLGLAYYETSQFPNAAVELEQVLKTTPGNLRAAILLGDCRFRQGEYKAVIDLLSPFENTARDNRAVKYLLGTALIRDNQTQRGQALIDRILSQGDSAEAHLMLGTMRMMTLDAKGALAEFERAVQLNPKLPSVHSANANALLTLNEPARAAEEYRRELEINPNDFDANLMLGVLLRKEDRYDDALKHLTRALELRPRTPDAAYQVALVEIAKGQHLDAQRSLEELIKRHPDFLEAHVSLATVYYRLKRKEDGDREREIVRKLTAESQAKQTEAVRASVTEQPAQPQPAAAQQAPRPEAPAAPQPPEKAAAQPEGFDAVAAQAAAARDADRVDEAVELYGRAVRLRPSWAEGWWYLGTLHYDKDRYAEARDAFTKLTSFEPKNGPGFAMLGLCEFRLKDYKRALVDIEQGRNLGLGSSEELVRVARYHSAILQTRFGASEQALRLLYALARAGGAEAPSMLEALGLAALRMPLLPAEIPEAKREMVRLAGRAHALLADRNRMDARKYFDALLAAYPNEPGVHYAAGVYLLAEDGEKALHEFEAELKVSPKDVSARLQIAFEYLRRAEYDKGITYAEEAVKLAPDLFVAYNVLGRLLLGAEKPDRAVKILETAVRLAPDSPETRFALAQAYARAGRGPDAARERAEFKRLETLRRERQSGRPAEPRVSGEAPAVEKTTEPPADGDGQK